MNRFLRKVPYLSGLLTIGVFSLLVGCVAYRHAATFRSFEGYVVPVSSRPGTVRLQVEMDYDPTVEWFVEMQGTPEYIYVVSRTQLKLIYTDLEKVATFKRGVSCKSEVSTSGITPEIREKIEQASQSASLP